MSGDKNKPDLHQEERQDALAQNGVLDAVMTMTKIVPFGSVRGVRFGSASFENHELNQMIDIVESANPELLESAGRALVDARDAIKEAATELRTNLGGDLDWKGEARNAFSDWRDSLVKTAEGVADYADIIGTQVMAAGTGLASVRKSMPPRDTRLVSKRVQDFTEVEKIETNEQYTQAVKVEKNRQEAINQMYRLASFYTVSAGMMGSAEEPVFPKMPDAGVPKPTPGSIRSDPPGVGNASLTSPSSAPTEHHQSSPTGEVGRASAIEQQLSARESSEPAALPKRPVGTEINSVGTLPPQEAVKPINAAPPSMTGPTAPAGPVPPMAPSAIPPTARGLLRRATGPGGGAVSKVSPPVRGRVGGPMGPDSASRTGAGPLGQTPRGVTPGPMGSRGTGPLGQAARTAPPGQGEGRAPGPMGRGIVGGTPRPGAPAPGPAGGGFPRGPVNGTQATPSGRSAGRNPDGVVGGRSVPSAMPGSNASKLPRGTVIGGEGTSAQRPAGQRPGQRGVIGAPAPAPRTGEASRRPAANPDGVVGAPNGRTSGTGNGGLTPRRPAAPRGGAGNQGSYEGRSRRDRRRDNQATTD
ncbi:hypothetical protein [Streptomyces sp. NPDC057363]|uniref:hypothetical protein n=1 Tax=Streptomyces sp. NPDC057363 TaxID=3346107 RepID=UPI00363B1F46